MALSDHTRNVKLMTSTVVAIVAFVGLVMIYSDYSQPLAGAAQYGTESTWQKSLDFGSTCGTCAKAADSKQPLPAACSRQTSLGTLYKLGEDRAKEKCCWRACTESHVYERCQTICSDSANDAFLEDKSGRYSGNPYKIAAYS